MNQRNRDLVTYAKRRQDEISIFNDLLDKPTCIEEFYDGVKRMDFLCPINIGLMNVLIYIRHNILMDGRIVVGMRDLADACNIPYQQAGKHIKTLEQKGLLIKEQDGMWKVLPPLKEI